MKRIFAKGDRYSTIVTVAKVKKDVPTVIEMSGRRYVLVHEDQYKRIGGK